MVDCTLAQASRSIRRAGRPDASFWAVNGPEAAGRGGFTVVCRGGPKSEIRAVHRCAKPLAGVALRVGCHVVTGQGVVRVCAGC